MATSTKTATVTQQDAIQALESRLREYPGSPHHCMGVISVKGKSKGKFLVATAGRTARIQQLNIVNSEGESVRVIAYHLSYLATHGRLPADGEELHHRCNNPGCCNVEHLAIIPAQYNLLLSQCSEKYPACSSEAIKEFYGVLADVSCIGPHALEATDSTAQTDYERI